MMLLRDLVRNFKCIVHRDLQVMEVNQQFRFLQYIIKDYEVQFQTIHQVQFQTIHQVL